MKVLGALRGHKAWFFKNVAVSVRGIPDIVGCLQGVFFALELKVRPNVADELQKHRIRQIKRAGGFAAVVYPETLDEVLQQLILFVRNNSCNN